MAELRNQRDQRTVVGADLLSIRDEIQKKTCSGQVLCELRRNAARFSADKDLTVFRRFNGLRTFYIYYCQRELVELEKRLEAPFHIPPAELKALMQLTGEALQRYSEALSASLCLAQFPTPSAETVDGAVKVSVESGAQYISRDFRFRWTPDPPLMPNKDTDIENNGGYKWPWPRRWRKTKESREGKANIDIDDLAFIAVKEKTWLHRFIDRHEPLKRRFQVEAKKANASPELIYSELAVRRAERVFLTISFCILLVLPLTLLSYVKGSTAKLGIVIGFLTFTSSCFAIMTDASSKDIMTGSAAYGAVLAVFLGNNQGN